MENVVKSRLQSLQFAEPQTYKNITIVPLIASADGTLQYRTLGEGLAASDVAIAEVSTGGSVPELMVVNRGETPVLLVDGEELAGAKQNRVLNTSILLKQDSETKIPVSCTEQGRWSYSSNFFSESGHIMAHKSRSRKSSSVLSSLKSSGAYSSDQGEVWQEIAALHMKAGTRSPTSAMSDVFKARDEDLRKCDQVFTLVPNQVGLLAFIGDRPAGLDMVSRTSAYSRLHSKLVRSYTLEALLLAPMPGKDGLDPSSASQASTNDPQPVSAPPFTARARQFLDDIMAAEERQFPSIGHGTDFRYHTPPAPSTINPQQPPASQPSTPTLPPQTLVISGSALVHENEVIHAAFFRLDEPEQPERMASYRSRRRHFTD